MRVAITGASGFVGRHVLNHLINEDVEIVAVTRNRNALAKEYQNIEIVEHDIADASIDVYQKLKRPDALIHLAWDGLPNYKSLHHFETELPRQYNFIKHMVESGLNTLFISGTCFEYGMQSGELVASNQTYPSNPYGLAKDTLRKQLEYLQGINAFNLIWGRLFYIYGEGQSESSLYSQLKAAVKRGDKVFNMSGGEQLRDFLPVETIANQIVKMSLSEKGIGIVNVCNGEPISVRNLVELWKKENNWDIELNLGYYPYPDYEPMEFWGRSNQY